MKVHPAGTELLPGYWVARQVEIPFFPKPAQCVLRKPGKVDQRQIRVHLRIPTVPQQLSLLVCESQESRPSASLAMTRVSGGLCILPDGTTELGVNEEEKCPVTLYPVKLGWGRHLKGPLPALMEKYFCAGCCPEGFLREANALEWTLFQRELRDSRGKMQAGPAQPGSQLTQDSPSKAEPRTLNSSLENRSCSAVGLL